jgi:RecA-family ATPase
LGHGRFHGGIALGKITVEEADVLYLALEDGRRRLQKRIRKLLEPIDAPAPQRLHLATSWPRLDEGGIGKLMEWLKEHPQCRLVVIDTLAKIRPNRISTQPAYQNDYSDVSSLKAVADRYGCAILVVHHVRKLVADDPIDAISGTSGLSGSADSVMILKRQRGQKDATLFITGRDLEESNTALVWDPESATWSAIGAADEYRMTKERTQVVEALNQAGRPLKPSEVASLISKKPEATR